MISLKKILYEVFNTFSVEVDLFVDPKAFVSDILNEIRAVRGVTIVTSITTDDYVQKKGDQYVRLKMKFITRDEAKDALQRFLNDVLAKEEGEDEYRIQGIKSIKFRDGTIKRL